MSVIRPITKQCSVHGYIVLFVFLSFVTQKSTNINQYIITSFIVSILIIIFFKFQTYRKIFEIKIHQKSTSFKVWCEQFIAENNVKGH